MISFIADSDRSEYTVSALRDMEALAASERAAVADLASIAQAPVWLPSPEQILEHYVRLEPILAGDPDQGREALRQFLRGGHIPLKPGEDGVYTAAFDLLPPKALRLAVRPGESRSYAVRFAGARMPSWANDIGIDWSLRLVA